MSKQAIGWCCAVVAIAGLWTTAQLTAQEGKPVGVSARHSVEAANQRINAALDQQLKTPLSYEEEQLDIVLNAISDEYDLPIVFDKTTLDQIAISPESEVSVNLRNISLRATLNLMFKEPGLEDLCYLIDEEVLLITTTEKANETLLTKVYRVDDFEMTNEHLRPRGASAWAVYSPIVAVITSCVEQKTWRENGTGEGEIQIVQPGMLVITQTRHVHDQIEKLFDKLRHTKQQILGGANRTASSAKPVTKGYSLLVQLGKNPEQTQKQIAKAIKSSVDWSEGELVGNETWIEMLPDRALVRHLPSVLNQVEIVLVDMGLIRGYGGNRGGNGGGGGGGGFGGGGGGGGAF